MSFYRFYNYFTLQWCVINGSNLKQTEIYKQLKCTNKS